MRDLWKAAVTTKAPPVVVDKQPEAMAVVLPLLNELEGCRLSAYPDPATGGVPWTIGWGSTRHSDGRAVQPGDAISQSQADALLIARLESDWLVLEQTIPGWESLSSHQQAALLSFSYNCGPRWFGRKDFSTLTACLRQGQLAQVPAALMRYVNPGNPAEAGLRRRRRAEGALWQAGLPHANPLVGVPRFQQRDSGQRGQRERSCFSSSCAMLLETLKPGTLKGAHGDDQYLAVVQRFGDTTDASAQLRALAHFGMQARLVQNADFGLIEQQIHRGIPVPCGYLHRGPVDRPTGGGHWLIVIGHTPSHLIVNDPWGEPDLIHGTTLNAHGMGLCFSRQNFGKRWMVEPIGTGAYRHAPGKGWAVLVDKVS